MKALKWMSGISQTIFVESCPDWIGCLEREASGYGRGISTVAKKKGGRLDETVKG